MITITIDKNKEDMKELSKTIAEQIVSTLDNELLTIPINSISFIVN